MIYVSTSCLPGTEWIFDRLRRLHDFGLTAVELGQHIVVKEGDLVRLCTMQGSFLIHNYFPSPPKPFVLNLASGDPVILQRSLELASKAINLAACLRAPIYSVHAGFVTDPAIGPDGFEFPAPGSPEEASLALRRFLASLESLLKQAERLHVQLLVENNVCTRNLQGKLLLQTAEEFLDLFRAIRSPSLGVLLDTGHLNITAQTLDFDPVWFTDQLAPYIRAFHVHYNDGTTDSHHPVQPGSWVLEVLQKPDFAKLPVIIEARFETVAALRHHVNWLRAILDFK